MRILMVAPEQFPLPGSGSVEISMLAIAKRLARHHGVTIVCRRHRGHAANERDGNLEIVRVASGSRNVYIANVLSAIRSRSFDVIQVDNRPGYAAKVKKAFPHTPVALFLHSLTFVPKTAKTAAHLKQADLIVTNSVSVRMHLKRRFPGVAAKIRTVHLGVDAARFRPPGPALRRRRRADFGVGTAYSVLFAGRLIPRKGIPVLMRAVRMSRKQVPNVKLIVAGAGKSAAYVRRLKAQAKRLGIAAVFVGKVPHATIHRLYQAADCFVCPSQRHEAFGLVNVEAMSAGLPVIASRIGGIQEIIDHGKNGYLTSDYRNPASFAAYIAKLATNPRLARALSANARRTALRRFTWTQTAEHLSALYRNL